MRYAIFLFSLLFACTPKQERLLVVNEIASPAASPSGEPWLFTDASGVPYLSWIEVLEGKNYLKFSRLQDNQWQTARVIYSGENWFVNWADYPVVVADGKEMMAHFLKKSGSGKFAYDVMVTQSHDGGSTWTEPVPVHDDGKQAEHGFVSMLPYENNFLVTWLDGRNTVMEGMKNHEGHHGQMSIRAAIVDQQGKKFKDWELDNRTCDCCQTTAALTNSGPVIVYRDRSEEELRDIAIVRLVNGEWTSPVTVYYDNWKIAGCPVNGPRAEAIGDDLAIAWYAVPDGEAKVQVIFSSDGGSTFEKPVRVDEGKPIGRVDLVLINKDEAIISWMEEADIKVAKVSRSGEKKTLLTIASTSQARSSGFPQMTVSGKQLIFAWTDDAEKKIRTAIVDSL
jgi:hypothetical protein